MKTFKLFYTILFFLLISCSSNTKPNKVSKKPEQLIVNKNKQNNLQSDTTEKKIKKKKPFKLTSENAVTFFEDYGKKNPENKVVIKTSYGDIYLRLYRDTPLHRAAFIYLVKKKYFDETLFYRVTKRFVIQGGNTNDRAAVKKRASIGNFELPQEKRKGYIHTVGKLSAAKNYEDNPNDLSNPYNFFIVAGRKLTPKSIEREEIRNGKELSDTVKKLYLDEGGSPHLDGLHTIFGEVTNGMDVVEKINNVAVDQSHWPIEDIKMTVEIVK